MSNLIAERVFRVKFENMAHLVHQYVAAKGTVTENQIQAEEGSFLEKVFNRHEFSGNALVLDVPSEWE
ncbi:MAG: hypothetical protein LBT22_02425 [Peptococcaceae bacterium]|jgi:hypothetical protein|nr:hypothetical protein [Peptococcaceae bacterium]